MAKGMYAVVQKTVPTYNTQTKTLALTSWDTMSTVFTYRQDQYNFYWNGTNFISSNNGVDSSTARTTFTALYDMTVSFNYACSSESNYDKLRIIVNGTTTKEVSGTVSATAYNCSLKKGQNLVFEYSKDGSQSSGSDRGTISNISVTYTIQTQTGSETKTLTSKIKKTYCVVGGVTKKIKKVYAVVGGVTRLVWSGSGGGTIKKYATTPEISVARYSLSGVSVGNYALFGGGHTGSAYSNVVDTYNSSLTRSITTGLAAVGGNIATASTGDYAFFGGGLGASYLPYLTTYNSSLTRTVPNQYLNTARSSLTAVHIGDYVIFGGGQTNAGDSAYTNAVECYNKSFSRTIPSSLLSVARGKLSATSIGNYALFGGGRGNGNINYSYIDQSVVDTYNTSLTKGVATNLCDTKIAVGAASVEEFAIFAGGMNSVTNKNTVDTYNASLTKGTATSLSAVRSSMISISFLNEYAVFGGGSSAGASNIVEYYDTSLTLKISDSLDRSKTGIAGASVGNYIIFTGGRYNNYPHETTDIYQLIQ